MIHGKRLLATTAMSLALIGCKDQLISNSTKGACSQGYFVSNPDGHLQAKNIEDLPEAMQAKAEPNAPVFILGTEYQNGWQHSVIQTSAAHTLGATGSQVIVAVVDTGVDVTHPDLAANIWTNSGEIPSNGVDDDHNGVIDDVHGARFLNGSSSGDTSDDVGHGTHVAGIIGALKNNTSVVGVAPNVKIIPVRFMDGEGKGYVSDGIRAIDYAVRMGAKVINLSWGSNTRSDALKSTIANYAKNGVIFIAAAGNDGINLDKNGIFPGAFALANMATVGSTTSNGGSESRSSFSNYGNNTVSLFAPGGYIYSTLPGGYYGTMSGTSMATPMVTGAVAALASLQSGTKNYGAALSYLSRFGDNMSSLSSIYKNRINLAMAAQAQQQGIPVAIPAAYRGTPGTQVDVSVYPAGNAQIVRGDGSIQGTTLTIRNTDTTVESYSNSGARGPEQLFIATDTPEPQGYSAPSQCNY